MLLRPPPEAKRVARDQADELKQQTRADLLRYQDEATTRVQGSSGTMYELRVYSFLDYDHPDSDLFVEVRARPARSRLFRTAKAGFLVDDESQIWDRGEVIGRLPTSGS